MNKILSVVAAFALVGCASQKLAMHQPSLDTTQIVRSLDSRGIAVGDFKLAPGLKPGLDQAVSVRGSSLTSPIGNSLSSYLREALVADLRSGGKYDPNSNTVISGQLTHNELNAAGVSTANAALGATFSVTKNGAQVYEKNQEARQTWKSSFIGAVAIPEAVNHYTDVYPQLIRLLLEDPEFRAAIKSK